MTAATAPLAAAPGTGVVYSAETLFRPGCTEPVDLPTVSLSVAVVILVIGLAVVTVMEARGRLAERHSAGPARETAGEPDPAPGPGARFLDRLPEKLGRDLVYLETADHYVEAVTTSGSTLVLMRFVDAVAELDGTDGLRVHRSYWIASRHVAGSARRRGRTVLRLTGGREVPVSRTHIAAVRAA